MFCFIPWTNLGMHGVTLRFPSPGGVAEWWVGKDLLSPVTFCTVDECICWHCLSALTISHLLFLLLAVALGNRTRRWWTPECTLVVYNSNFCRRFLWCEAEGWCPWWALWTLTNQPPSQISVCFHRDVNAQTWVFADDMMDVCNHWRKKVPGLRPALAINLDLFLAKTNEYI